MLARGEDIRRFAETASPGDHAVYGRGDRPPAALVEAMLPFVEAGVLHPLRKREGREFLFLIERGSAPMGPASERRARRGYVRRQSVRRSSLSMVFECLKAAAVRDCECPTNAELAKRCRLSGKDAARYRMHLLEQKGRIAVDPTGPDGGRVVTILTGRHAGKSTRRVER